MIILVSNDDGISSDGLHSLVKPLSRLGDVWTVAPERVQNAMGRALTLHRPLKATKLSERRFMVNGTPSDCINIAVNGLLPQKPALVVAGINKGANLSDDISYSGTVAAAFEATILGIPALAVSLAGRKNFVFGPAARFTAKLAAKVLGLKLPDDNFLNINIPDTGDQEISSFRITHQGKSIYDNTTTETINPRGEKYYWIGGDGTSYEQIDGSDSEAILQNCASITPIKTDLTDYAAIEYLKKWKL